MRLKEVLQLFIDTFNQADAKALSLLYAGNAVNHQVPDDPICGRENIKKFFENEFAQAKMVCIVENIFEDGQWAIMVIPEPLTVRSRFIPLALAG